MSMLLNISRCVSLTLPVLVPLGEDGESCKGPTPLVDLKSFLPVVHMRVLVNPLASSG